jgi:filamentous hemagglutinin family protein
MACPPRPPARWCRFLCAFLLRSALLLGVLRGSSAAQITLDGSLGPGGPLTGPDYRIGAELGQLRANNLFHSFGQFHVPTGGSATFSGPQTIANILSRVTGGQRSEIDGRLRSEIAGANLYLLNPSGVLFGPNASLEVRGSLHVSTADVLRFADGTKFFANLGQDSVLTVAEPVAFGFLDPNPAAIAIQGSTLQVPAGKALSVVGGDINIVGDGGPLTTESVRTLKAPGGRLALASVASPGDVVFTPLELAPELQVDSFARLGRLTLSRGAVLDASGHGGGVVLLRGGRLFVDQAWMSADNTGPVDGSGLGMDLRIAADAIIVTGSFITTDSAGGRARDLRLTADGVHLDASLIGSRTTAGSLGHGGNIEVRVGRLALTGGARISSSTAGAGGGGALTVVATDTITITGQSLAGASELSSETQGQGPGGHLRLAAPRLELRDGGTISAHSTGGGAAGTLMLDIGETFRSQGGRVTTAAEGAGGGRIELRAGSLVYLLDSALTTTVHGGGGDAGDLTLESPFVIAEGSQIVANAFEGRGGNIRLRADVFLADPASLISASSALGIQGTVHIQAPVTSLSGTLAPLPQTFVHVAALLPARCAARFSGGMASSLVLGGREGLPLDPGGLLPSPLTLEERLVVDPVVTEGPHQRPSTTEFTFLTGADKAIPRLQGDQWAGRCPKEL